LGQSATSDTFLSFALAGLELKYLKQGISRIKQILGCPQSVARRIATMVLCNFIKDFKHRIWTTRNEAMQRWEQLNGIRPEDKISDSRKNKRRRVAHEDRITLDGPPVVVVEDPYLTIQVHDTVGEDILFANTNNNNDCNRLHSRPITRRMRQIKAIPAVWSQMKDYIVKNTLHPWSYIARHIFMPDTLVL